jgi:hypothetical protein
MFRESWIVYGISYIVYRRDAKFCVSTIIATIATITIITIIITITTIREQSIWLGKFSRRTKKGQEKR